MKPTLPAIVMDARMLGGAISGVATFAASLRGALDAVRAPPLLLDAKPGRESRVARWMHAAWPGSRRLHYHATEGVLLGRTGLFREAQIYFNIHKRPMAVETDQPPGIMHWTYPLPIYFKGWTNLYTVHDAIPMTAPHLTDINGDRHRGLLNALLDAGGRLLTVSHASQREIADSLALNPADIEVCWQGVGTKPALHSGVTKRDYFLFCGTLEARKNIAGMVTAHKRSGTALPLLLAGNVGTKDADIAAALANNPSAHYIGAQERAKLERLIAGARALLFVSHAEGFGLPIVEAQLLGTPVLTSNQGAQAEVAGDAALQVDPRDISAMADAIHRLAVDSQLGIRLREAGLERSVAFTLPAFGARLENIYRRLNWTGA